MHPIDLSRVFVTKFYIGFCDYFPHRFLGLKSNFPSPFVTKFCTGDLKESILPGFGFSATRFYTALELLTIFRTAEGQN